MFSTTFQVISRKFGSLSDSVHVTCVQRWVRVLPPILALFKNTLCASCPRAILGQKYKGFHTIAFLSPSLTLPACWLPPPTSKIWWIRSWDSWDWWHFPPILSNNVKRAVYMTLCTVCSGHPPHSTFGLTRIRAVFLSHYSLFRYN